MPVMCLCGVHYFELRVPNYRGLVGVEVVILWADYKIGPSRPRVLGFSGVWGEMGV